MAQAVARVEGERRRERSPPPPPHRHGIARGAVKARQEARKRDRRARRALDELFLWSLADFDLVICEGCGLEFSNHPQGTSEFATGCLVCGHLYARGCPRRIVALAAAVDLDGRSR